MLPSPQALGLLSPGIFLHVPRTIRTPESQQSLMRAMSDVRLHELSQLCAAAEARGVEGRVDIAAWVPTYTSTVAQALVTQTHDIPAMKHLLTFTKQLLTDSRRPQHYPCLSVLTNLLTHDNTEVFTLALQCIALITSPDAIGLDHGILPQDEFYSKPEPVLRERLIVLVALLSNPVVSNVDVLPPSTDYAAIQRRRITQMSDTERLVTFCVAVRAMAWGHATTQNPPSTQQVSSLVITYRQVLMVINAALTSPDKTIRLAAMSTLQIQRQFASALTPPQVTQMVKSFREIIVNLEQMASNDVGVRAGQAFARAAERVPHQVQELDHEESMALLKVCYTMANHNAFFPMFCDETTYRLITKLLSRGFLDCPFPPHSPDRERLAKALTLVAAIVSHSTHMMITSPTPFPELGKPDHLNFGLIPLQTAAAITEAWQARVPAGEQWSSALHGSDAEFDFFEYSMTLGSSFLDDLMFGGGPVHSYEEQGRHVRTILREQIGQKSFLSKIVMFVMNNANEVPFRVVGKATKMITRIVKELGVVDTFLESEIGMEMKRLTNDLSLVTPRIICALPVLWGATVSSTAGKEAANKYRPFPRLVQVICSPTEAFTQQWSAQMACIIASDCTALWRNILTEGATELVQQLQDRNKTGDAFIFTIGFVGALLLRSETVGMACMRAFLEADGVKALVQAYDTIIKAPFENSMHRTCCEIMLKGTIARCAVPSSCAAVMEACMTYITQAGQDQNEDKIHWGVDVMLDCCLWGTSSSKHTAWDTVLAGEHANGEGVFSPFFEKLSVSCPQAHKRLVSALLSIYWGAKPIRTHALGLSERLCLKHVVKCVEQWCGSDRVLEFMAALGEMPSLMVPSRREHKTTQPQLHVYPCAAMLVLMEASSSSSSHLMERLVKQATGTIIDMGTSDVIRGYAMKVLAMMCDLVVLKYYAHGTSGSGNIRNLLTGSLEEAEIEHALSCARALTSVLSSVSLLPQLYALGTCNSFLASLRPLVQFLTCSSLRPPARLERQGSVAAASSPVPSPPSFVPNRQVEEQLAEMGFPGFAVRRAQTETQSNELAVLSMWLIEHPGTAEEEEMERAMEMSMEVVAQQQQSNTKEDDEKKNEAIALAAKLAQEETTRIDEIEKQRIGVVTAFLMALYGQLGELLPTTHDASIPTWKLRGVGCFLFDVVSPPPQSLGTVGGFDAAASATPPPSQLLQGLPSRNNVLTRFKGAPGVLVEYLDAENGWAPTPTMKLNIDSPSVLHELVETYIGFLQTSRGSKTEDINDLARVLLYVLPSGWKKDHMESCFKACVSILVNENVVPSACFELAAGTVGEGLEHHTLVQAVVRALKRVNAREALRGERPPVIAALVTALHTTGDEVDVLKLHVKHHVRRSIVNAAAAAAAGATGAAVATTTNKPISLMSTLGQAFASMPRVVVKELDGKTVMQALKPHVSWTIPAAGAATGTTTTTKPPVDETDLLFQDWHDIPAAASSSMETTSSNSYSCDLIDEFIRVLHSSWFGNDENQLHDPALELSCAVLYRVIREIPRVGRALVMSYDGLRVIDRLLFKPIPRHNTFLCLAYVLVALTTSFTSDVEFDHATEILANKIVNACKDTSRKELPALLDMAQFLMARGAGFRDALQRAGIRDVAMVALAHASNGTQEHAKQLSVAVINLLTTLASPEFHVTTSNAWDLDAIKWIALDCGLKLHPARSTSTAIQPGMGPIVAESNPVYRSSTELRAMLRNGLINPPFSNNDEEALSAGAVELESKIVRLDLELALTTGPEKSSLPPVVSDCIAARVGGYARGGSDANLTVGRRPVVSTDWSGPVPLERGEVEDLRSGFPSLSNRLQARRGMILAPAVPHARGRLADYFVSRRSTPGGGGGASTGRVTDQLVGATLREVHMDVGSTSTDQEMQISTSSTTDPPTSMADVTTTTTGVNSDTLRNSS